MAARVNLALMLNKLKRYSLALPHLFKARERAPADESIWRMLRASLLRLGRHEDALADFLRFEPYPARAARAVPALWAARRMGDVQGEERAVAAALSYPYARVDSALVAEAVGHMQYHDVLRESLLELYRTYNRVVRAELEAVGDALPLAPATPRKIARDDRRIRIGYLSADFRQHVMGEILAPVLALHDRSRFEIRLYSIAPAANEDALLPVAADDFVCLSDDDDPAAARKIAADDLDLLVELMAHSAYSRPGIMARKPARVVATHLGSHGALGKV